MTNSMEQDRFKFRYVYVNKLYDVEMIDFSTKYVYFKERDNKVCTRVELNFKNLSQSTGLKDKNGKLIFEGDILEILHSGGKRAEVYWNKNNVCFELKGEAVTYNAHITIRNDYFEIIGNIYENPELLESKA